MIYRSQQRAQSRLSRPTSRTAMIVEALVLLLILCMCLAVLVSALIEAFAISNNAAQLESAVMAAQSTAEEFAASPQSFDGEVDIQQGDFDVCVKTTDAECNAGVLRQATITIYGEDGVSISKLAQVAAGNTGTADDAASTSSVAAETDTPNAHTQSTAIYSLKTSAYIPKGANQ